MLVQQPRTASTLRLTSKLPSQVLTLRRLPQVQRTRATWSGFGRYNKPDPVWVDTHKGVPELVVESKPSNPCKVCLGRGKVVCGTCDGKGTSQTLYKLSTSSVLAVAMPAVTRVPTICEDIAPFGTSQDTASAVVSSTDKRPVRKLAHNADKYVALQAEQMDYSTECCQVGCGPNGAQAAGAVAYGTVKGEKNCHIIHWTCKQGHTEPALL